MIKSESPIPRLASHMMYRLAEKSSTISDQDSLEIINEVKLLFRLLISR